MVWGAPVSYRSRWRSWSQPPQGRAGQSGNTVRPDHHWSNEVVHFPENLEQSWTDRSMRKLDAQTAESAKKNAERRMPVGVGGFENGRLVSVSLFVLVDASPTDGLDDQSLLDNASG